MKRLFMMLACVSGIRCDALETKNIVKAIKKTFRTERTAKGIIYAVAGVASVVGIAFIAKRRFDNQALNQLNSASSTGSRTGLVITGIDRQLLETQYEGEFRQLQGKAGVGLNNGSLFIRIMVLVNQGIDHNYLYEGQTLLQLVCLAGDLETANQLIEKGAKVDDTCWFNALQIDRAKQYKGHSNTAYTHWHKYRVGLLNILKAHGAHINAASAQGSAWKQAEGKDNLLQSYLLEHNAHKQ